MHKSLQLKSLYPQTISKTGYLTHGFDRYPAKMIPHMARFLIEKISKPGDTILDPFCGSGSVLVESLTCGRNAIGIDLNRLAVIFSKAKTAIYKAELLETQLEDILRLFTKCRTGCRVDFPNAAYWFTPATLEKLGIIRTCLNSYLTTVDPNYSSFWYAVFAVIVRECSRADTRGPKPFISKKARETRVGRHFDPLKLFALKARSWIALQDEFRKKLLAAYPNSTVKVIEGDSRNLFSLLDNETIDAVVTSPPYLNAQDYYRASKLEMSTLGLSSPAELTKWSRELIGSDRILTNNSVEVKLPFPSAETIRLQLQKKDKKDAYVFSKYVLDMIFVLRHLYGLLAKGSYCALVSSYNLISGVVIPTHRVIREAALNEGFHLTATYQDKIRDRWVPIMRNGHNGVITEEYLMLFRK
jgi:DNA modification methylase